MAHIPKKKRSPVVLHVEEPWTHELETHEEGATWRRKELEAPQTRKDPKSIQGRLGRIRRVLPRPSKGTGYACALGRGWGKVSLRGAYEFLKAQSHRSSAVLVNLIKPLRFKLQHYPCHDPTMVPGFTGVRTVMSIKGSTNSRAQWPLTRGMRTAKGIAKAFSKDEIDGQDRISSSIVSKAMDRSRACSPVHEQGRLDVVASDNGSQADLRSRNVRPLGLHS